MLMTNAEKMRLIRMVADAMFGAKASNLDMLNVTVHHPNIVGDVRNGRWFKNAETGEQTIRGFDIDINDGNKILNLRFMEQNPDKTDGRGNLKWTAILARKGHKMMWVVNRNAQVGGFLGRLQDGEWIPSKERAYTGADAAYSHIERDINNPNFHGIPGTSVDHGQPIENTPDIPADMGIPEYVLYSYADMEDE